MNQISEFPLTRNRMISCKFIIEQTAKISGDIAEFGVCNGDNLFCMTETLKKNNIAKKIYAFDCFQGLPYKEGVLEKGECKGLSYKDFLSAVKENEAESIVVPVKGLVEETLGHYKDRQFSFVYLDLDLKKSTNFVYNQVQNQIVTGGVLGFHDYLNLRTPGITEIVNSINLRMFDILFADGDSIFFKRI